MVAGRWTCSTGRYFVSSTSIAGGSPRRDAVPIGVMIASSSPSSTPAPAQPHLAAPDVNPSFTKSVFLGEIREDLVFPFPTLTDEERESLRMMLDSLRSWASEHVDSARFDHDGKF